MWFTREQFKLGSELRTWGLEPRFEPGDIVARGFADLGHEEFQVLPGPKLLSLTAGTTTPVPDGHTQHFFWIPSADECVALLEKRGVACLKCERVDGREWLVQAQCCGEIEAHRAASLHAALLTTLLAACKRAYKEKTS